jgi:hypothetical protein
MMETEQRVAATLASGRGIASMAVAVLLIAAAAAGMLLLGGRGHRANENENDAHLMEKCREAIIPQLNANVDLTFLASVDDLCYSQASNEEVLTEFEIRKEAYHQQQDQGPWLLGLVLVITLSGVLLAAVQLFWGYKLSAAGKAVAGDPAASTLSLTPTGVSVSSTVTGVLILALSFAFFYIFIQQVYVVHEPPPPEAGTHVPTGKLGSLKPLENSKN